MKSHHHQKWVEYFSFYLFVPKSKINYIRRTRTYSNYRVAKSEKEKKIQQKSDSPTKNIVRQKMLGKKIWKNHTFIYKTYQIEISFFVLFSFGWNLIFTIPYLYTAHHEMYINTRKLFDSQQTTIAMDNNEQKKVAAWAMNKIVSKQESRAHFKRNKNQSNNRQEIYKLIVLSVCHCACTGFLGSVCEFVV